jgi:hypothetical protein
MNMISLIPSVSFLLFSIFTPNLVLKQDPEDGSPSESRYSMDLNSIDADVYGPSGAYFRITVGGEIHALEGDTLTVIQVNCDGVLMATQTAGTSSGHFVFSGYYGENHPNSVYDADDPVTVKVVAKGKVMGGPARWVSEAEQTVNTH